jgi:uncharacterized SAM-binding protein YcdF (DUF218 family)
MKGLGSRGVDGDAMFTLILSLLAGALTLGLSHLIFYYRIRKRALLCNHICSKHSAIVVPGHRLENRSISAEYKCRLDRSATIYFESVKCTHSGNTVIRIIGGRPQHGLSEAQAGKQYLIRKGIAGVDISLEEKSTNTLENLKHSRDWFADFDEVVLVTNRYHLERLQTLASGLNLKIHPCAAEESVDLPLNKLLTETLFLHWYWVGRIYATLTRNHRMLDKIT